MINSDPLFQLPFDEIEQVSLEEIDAFNAKHEQPFTWLHKGIAGIAGCAAGVKAAGGYRQCWNIAVVSRYVPNRPGSVNGVLRYLCESHRKAAQITIPSRGRNWIF